MVNPVGPSGYQAYNFQPTVIPANETRGGANRVEQRQAPAPDTQRGDQREFASRDDNTTKRQEEPRQGPRGSNLDVVA